MNRLLVALMFVALGPGCASVKIMKVKSDDAEGIPFYLPRPYVTVFEPFVIGSSAYLVGGQLSPDGQYLLIDNVKLDSAGHFKLEKGESMAVPSRLVRRAVTPSQQPKLDGTQGKEEAPESTTPKPGASTPKNGESTTSKGNADDKTNSPGEPVTSVGQFNISVLNSNASFAVTPGRRFFDITWLPDFDEKYVVQGTPGLGNSNIAVTLGQGWSLQGLDAKLDNSAIVKPLLDFYKTSIDALAQLAKGKILPAGAIATDGTQGAPEISRDLAGTRLSIKVTVVQVAAPGIYPILKPSEIAKAEEVRKALEVPKANAPGLANASRLHLPIHPFTNVAYNTYEVLVVEAAKPSGDSPMNLQRYFDSVTIPSLPDATRAAIGLEPVTPQVLAKNLNEALTDQKGTDGAFWVISDVKSQNAGGKKWSMTATLTGGKSAPSELTNKAQLQTFIAGYTQKGSLPSDITLTLK